MSMFKRVVGTINRSQLKGFRPDLKFKEDTARYFIPKRAFDKGGIYYIYSFGVDKETNEEIKYPRCLDLFNEWRFSFNDSVWVRSTEMLEINMEE